MPSFDIIERNTRFGKPQRTLKVHAQNKKQAVKKYLDFEGGFKTAEYIGPHIKKRRKR